MTDYQPPTLLDAAAACLHQLSTDADLETVSAPHKYHELVEMLKAAIYAVDPGFPALQNYDPPDELWEAVHSRPTIPDSAVGWAE